MDKEVQIIRIKEVDIALGCDLVFIGEIEDEILENLVGTLEGEPVLSVSHNKGYA